MATKKDEYLEGYELGIKKGKSIPSEPRLPDRYNKTMLDKILSTGERFFPQPSQVKNLRLKREADDKYLDSPMGKGEAQGRAEYDKASELESIRAKKNPPKAIPMTKEDAEVINTKEFKKASEATMDKKKGGVVKDLKKAGFYEAKKDKAKRLDIINKVTTKPERIEMVDKMFSAKKMAKGGTASSRADGCAVRGKTKA